MAAIQIRDVRVFLTAPDDQNLVAVRVDTTEPGLYGLGCATLAYRAFAVKDVVERSLKPLLLGRDVSRVQALWNLMMQNAYWRNGPVLNNAVSGVDMALWDIKAKAAGMPLFDLLGGKCRDRVDVYRHCNAASKQQVLELAQQAVDSGCKYIRAAYTAYDGPGEGGYLCLANQCKVYDPGLHRKNIVDLLEALRVRFGDAIALMTDTHERLSAQDAVKLAKALEPLDLLFMEDPVAPEQKEWLARIRQVCATPLAMGELLCTPAEWMPLVEGRLIDYLRCHLSAMGGLTPARKAAVVAEAYGVYSRGRRCIGTGLCGCMKRPVTAWTLTKKRRPAFRPTTSQPAGRRCGCRTARCIPHDSFLSLTRRPLTMICQGALGFYPCLWMSAPSMRSLWGKSW